ncbi:hypothetical protein OU787_17325 [Kitasatospora sp. YST-16]|uniref:hypothetical protein n=1 Tax=Kitasatospora sp. YST-16 TaxID=2998080 RepID=UPI0022840A58|nr:hypothetical protein [Kitasatospora sp. YST-16]WAL73112.1 hypothetical protein OU787_17325 [Kitasatospora sp. YST-16]WNW39166.1 hypothetical protein RKE32_17290 [Streptomyces sp. Li-HN-5-13]
MAELFDLDVWAAEARRTPFAFRAGGLEFTLPAAGDLDKAILATVNLEKPSADDVLTLLREGLADRWPDFDALPMPLGAVGELFKRWQAHEGIPLGESPASSDS